MSGGQHPDAEALASGVLHRAADVSRVLGDHHQRGPMLCIEIPSPAGTLVAVVAGGQCHSPQLGLQSLHLIWSPVSA